MPLARRFAAFGILLLATAISSGQEPSVPALTVLNFVNCHPGDGWDWLSKGLADMLITDLSASAKLRLVERERMQAFFTEMALAEKGLVDPESAARMGRMLKAKLALFGSFLVEDGQLKIEAHIVGVKSGELKRVEWVKGTPDDVFRMEKQLAEQILAKLDVPLTDAERERLRRFSTLKVDAAAAYYTAFGAYDEGEYPEALGWFRLACRRDAAYLEARFRAGEMYHSLGEPRHALVELSRVAASDTDSPYPPVAAYLCAKIKDERLGLPAAEDYMAVARRFPVTIPAVAAALRAGELYRQAGATEQAYEAYVTFDELVERCAPLRTEGMFRDSLLHRRLAHYRWAGYGAREFADACLTFWSIQGRKPPHVRGHVLYVTADKTAYRNNQFATARLPGTSARSYLVEKQGYAGRTGAYLLLPPPGMVFESLDFVLRVAPYDAGPLHEVVRRRLSRCRVWLRRPWKRGLGSFEERARAKAAGEPDAEFYGEKAWRITEPGEKTCAFSLPPGCRGVLVSVREGGAVLMSGWDVEARLAPAETPDAKEVPDHLREALGARRAAVHALCPCLYTGGDGRPSLVFSDRPLTCGCSPAEHATCDLRFAALGGGSRFATSVPFSYNSMLDDHEPCVARDPDGTWWMVFASRRSLPTGSDLFITSSADGRRWEFPRKIRLDYSGERARLSEKYRAIFGESEETAKQLQQSLENRVGATRYYRCPRLLVDPQGRFWLVFTLAGELYVTNSTDGVRWRRPAALDLGPGNDCAATVCPWRDGHVLVGCLAGRYGDYVCANPNLGKKYSKESMLGIFVADVAPDLTCEKVKVGHQKRPAYSLMAPEHRDLHLFRRFDGDAVMVYRRRIRTDTVTKERGRSTHLDADAHLYVCTSSDGVNWRTYQLADKWPKDCPRAAWYQFMRPMAACLDGDTLYAVLAGEHTELPVAKYDLSQELTAKNLRQPVIDEQGNRLPATAWVVVPAKDLVMRGLTETDDE